MYQKRISAQWADCVSRPLLALMTIRARDGHGTARLTLNISTSWAPVMMRCLPGRIRVATT
ncbi:hypothetical protein [Pantoea sp. OXWO6B1]|uniref:hypothetical protein n=1 Tax=Pantoea sp. OXWO6B1 TaxID=1835724 RepID=UPI0012E81D37|nr:hypothetical protein [Pantoea sp. OXWO6B1]